jgi:hypothetical protein
MQLRISEEGSSLRSAANVRLQPQRLKIPPAALGCKPVLRWQSDILSDALYDSGYTLARMFCVGYGNQIGRSTHRTEAID